MAFSTDSDGLTEEINVDFDAAQARRVAEQLASIIRRAFDQAFKGIEKDFNKVFSDAGTSSGARRMADGFDTLGASVKGVRNESDLLDEDLRALIKRSEAFKNSLRAKGTDSDVFAVYENQLAEAISLERRMQQNRVEIANDPDLRKAYAKEAQTILNILSDETVNIGRIMDRQRSQFVVEGQAAAAQRLAETRITGQRIIQNERQLSRARIEVFRFTARQILFIERQMADAFKGAARLISGGLRTIQAGAARVGQVFNRSNADLNDGLRGALLKRETSIQRSFSKQTSEIRGEVGRQTAIVQRFEKQASTGVLGALTGRSSVGTLVGGGLAIGGGFSLFQGLKEGLKVGGDFVQGLAVLQAQLKLTDAQMENVRQQSIDLGNDLTLPGVSALDAAQAIQILAKQFANLGAGALPAAQAAAKGVLQLSRAVGVGSEEAARVVGAAVNVFGIAAEDAVEVADQITNAMSLAAGVSFNNFADAFTQSASVINLFTGPASEATDTLAEFNAAIAVLAKGGLIGSDAGTSLKQFFLQANRGTVDSKEILAEIVERAGAVGDVFFDAAGGARTLGESLDILRAGTRGLSDQARTATLQKVFGSDATRAAAILINESAASFDRLTDAVGEQGSAAALAAAQNVGLRGALDALDSVIETQQIKTYEKFQGVAGKLVIQFAALLQQFFDGVGILGVVKDALIGAGAAIATLLVAKGAAEAIKILTIALRGLLTPLGLVVTALVVVAAAVNVLRSRVPSVQAAFDKLGDALGAGFTFIVTQLSVAFLSLATMIGNYLAPIIERVALFINNNLQRALRAAFIFITTVAIPAVQRLGQFIANELIPPLVTFADTIRDGVVAGLQVLRDQAIEVFNTVQPLIQPAIDGFQTLGTAIAEVFTDRDFSGLLPGLRTLGSGIASSFVNIGEALVAVIGPELKKVASFITDFFKGSSGTAGGGAGKGVSSFLTGPFQDAAEQIGFIVGNIVSDPRLIEALEKIVGLAVLTGVSLIKGLIRGILSNADELAELFGGQIADIIQAGLKEAFNPQAIAKAIVFGLGAAAIGVALFQTLRNPVEQSGKRAALGFVGSFTAQVKQGVRRNDFGSALFQGMEGFATKAAQRTAKALEKEQARAADNLRLLGAGPGGLGGAFVGVEGFTQASGDAVKQLKILRTELGEGAVAGGIMRGRLNDLGTFMGQFGGGVVQSLTGSFREGAKQAGNAIQGLGRTVGGLAGDIVRNFKQVGIGLGQALGGAIVSGVGAALSGKQLGGATSAGGQALGLAGIVSSALFAGVSVGGGAQGVAVGGLVAGIGLFSAAMEASGRKAKKAAEETQEYADALRNVQGALAPEAAKTVLSNIGDETEEVQLLLKDLGFDAQDFADQVVNGMFTAEDALNTIAPAFGENSGAVIAELKRLEGAGYSFQESLDFAAGAGLDEIFTPLRNLTAASDIDTIVDTFDSLTDETSELRDGLAAVSRERFFGRNIREQTDEAAAGFDNLRSSIQAGASQADAYVDGLLRAAGTSTGLEAASAKTAAAATQRLTEIQSVVDALNQARTDNLQSEIAAVTTELQKARDAAGQAFDVVLALVGDPLGDSLGQSLDNILVQLPELGTGIAEAFNTGVSALDLTPAGAALRKLIEPFTINIRERVKAGIEAGADTVPELITLFEDIKVQIGALDVPQDVQDFLLNQINGFLDNPSLAAALSDFVVKQEGADALQSELDALQLQLGINVFFSEDQIRSAFEETFGRALPGTLPDQFRPPTPATADAAERLGAGVTGLTRVESDRIHAAQLEAAVVTAKLAQAAIDRTSADRTVNLTVNQTINGAGQPILVASESVGAVKAGAGQIARLALGGRLS